MKNSLKLTLIIVGLSGLIGYGAIVVYKTLVSSQIAALDLQEGASSEAFYQMADSMAETASYVLTGVILLFASLSAILFIVFTKPIKYILHYAKNLSDGNYHDMPVTKNLGSEFGELMRSLVYVRDRLQASTQKLTKSYSREEEALKEVEVANGKRHDFLANISRGLRDPLNSILGFSAIIIKEIEQGAYDYKLREKANIIFSSADRLNGLIGNLIELSRLDAEDITLKVKDFETSEFMRDLIQYNLAEAEEKNISLGTHFTSELPPVLSSDREILFHILSNLICNAVTASPFGGNVSFGIEKDDDLFTFFVKDSVVEDDTVPLAKIYNKYVKSETELFRGIKGSSILNMTIVKAHVSLLNATIETELDSSGCSIFKIIFKYADIVSSAYTDDSAARFFLDSDNGGATEPTNEFETHNIIDIELDLDKPISVLMAESNEANRMLVETILDSGNCELEYVDDGIACLDVLNRRDFDVLLLDHHINKLDALKVVDALRANERFSSLPIIVMAAYLDLEDRKSLLMAGVNDCILKPINADELTYLVRSWFKKTQ